MTDFDNAIKRTSGDGMNDWLSSSEVAELLDISPRWVVDKARVEGWISRSRRGRGGGFEYHVESLPTDARETLKARLAADLATRRTAASLATSDAAKAATHEAAKIHITAEIEQQAAHNRRLEALKNSVSLPSRAQRRLDARLELLRSCEQFRQTRSLPIKQAEHLFAADYSAGTADAPAWVRELVPDVSAETLQRWRLTIKKEGISALAGAYGNRKGTSRIDVQNEVREFVIGMLVRTPHARATHIMQGLVARLGDKPIELPSMRSLERWIKDWKRENAQTFTALANPDAWKGRYMVAFGSQSEGVVRLNQRWEMDSTPADVMLTDGRHSIIGAIDVYARRPKLLVTKTSKSTAVATLVRRALLDWGVPEQAKTDNGKDYTSNHVTRVFTSLEIEHVLCPPFQPWHKPHIERFFGTFTRDLVELLDGFIGHNVAERQAIRDRQSFADRLMQRDQVLDISLSSEEFQNFCDRWCNDIYMHRAHDGLAGRTPFQTVTEWTDPLRRIGDERVLDVLLAEAPDRNGMRTVQKNGIQLDNAWFIAPELEAFVGQQVQVRFDPQDLGRLYIFGGPDLQFVCIAECPERTGMNRQEVAARGREIQRRRVQEERRALKDVARAVKTDDVVDEILRDRALKSGKLAILPRAAETHSSAGLTAAGDVVAALNAEPRTTADLMTPEAEDLARARIERTRLVPQPTFETPQQRVIWLLEEAHQRALTGEEQQYLENFKRTNRDSFQRMHSMIEQRHATKQNPASAG